MITALTDHMPVWVYPLTLRAKEFIIPDSRYRISAKT